MVITRAVFEGLWAKLKKLRREQLGTPRITDSVEHVCRYGESQRALLNREEIAASRLKSKCGTKARRSILDFIALHKLTVNEFRRVWVNMSREQSPEWRLIGMFPKWCTSTYKGRTTTSDRDGSRTSLQLFNSQMAKAHRSYLNGVDAMFVARSLAVNQGVEAPVWTRSSTPRQVGANDRLIFELLQSKFDIKLKDGQRLSQHEQGLVSAYAVKFKPY